MKGKPRRLRKAFYLVTAAAVANVMISLTTVASSAFVASKSIFAGLHAWPLLMPDPRSTSTISAGAEKVKRKVKKKPAKLGFNMPKVTNEPVTDYDTGPKVLEVLRYPHPALRRKNEEVTVFDSKLKQLAQNMFKTMYKENNFGVGLAAPQIGVNIRMMVFNAMRLERDFEKGETTFVNPKIKQLSEAQEEGGESCLSFPDMEGPVVRPKWVEVEYQDLDGKPCSQRLEGFEARVFLHEYDHLEGVLYTDLIEESIRERYLQSNLDRFIQEYEAGGGKNPML